MKNYKSTTNYSIFTQKQINRDLSKAYIKKMKDSIEKFGQLEPIKVSRDYSIIDGQHRFAAIKELGIPVNYVITEDMDFRTLAELNSISKKWTNEDFLKAYLNSGQESYVRLNQFRVENPDFPLQSCVCLLDSNSALRNQAYSKDIKSPTNKRGNYSTPGAFKQGNLKIKDYDLASKNASTIRSLSHFYKGYSKPTFVRTMIRLLNYDKFDFEILLHKLNNNPTALKDCNRIEDYLDMIQNIYNYKNRNPQLFTHLK